MTQDSGAENFTTPSPQSANTDTVFRTPVERTYTPTGSVRVEGNGQDYDPSIVEPAFSEYEQFCGLPFVASYLELNKEYGSLARKDINNIHAINSYVADKIATGEYSDSAEAAREIIEALENKLGVGKNNNPYYRAEKMAEFLAVVKDGVVDKPVAIVEKPPLQDNNKLIKKVTAVTQEVKESIAAAKVDLSPIEKRVETIAQSVDSKIAPIEKKLNKVLSIIPTLDRQITQGVERLVSLNQDSRSAAKLAQERAMKVSKTNSNLRSARSKVRQSLTELLARV